MNNHILNQSQEKTDKIDTNKLQCSVCGSKRQRNLVTKHFTAKERQPDGTNKRFLRPETRCKRCWGAFELLGNGKNRVHIEGSNFTSKPAYRYYSVAQADRVSGNPSVREGCRGSPPLSVDEWVRLAGRGEK